MFIRSMCILFALTTGGVGASVIWDIAQVTNKHLATEAKCIAKYISHGVPRSDIVAFNGTCRLK